MTDDSKPKDKETPQEEPSAADDIIDIGTEPVGESADPFYNLGTDTVLGSEPPSDDTIYMIGTDPVGKAREPEVPSRDETERSSDED